MAEEKKKYNIHSWETNKKTKILEWVKHCICIICAKKNKDRTVTYSISTFKIILPEHIIGTYIILPCLAKQEIKLMDCNTYQRTSINFFNQNHTKIVTIRKREPIANFITFNEGTENFNVKYERFEDLINVWKSANSEENTSTTKQEDCILKYYYIC